VLADLSINYVERQLLVCGCSVQRMHSDYGYDLITSTYNANGEIEAGIVYFQVKATDNLPLLVDGQTVSWVVNRRDLGLWFREAFPVILFVYDGRSDRAIWLHVQAYFAGYPSPELFLSGHTISIHVPVTERLNHRSVRRIVQRKNLTQAHLQTRDLPNA